LHVLTVAVIECNRDLTVEIPFQVAIGLNPKTTAANSVDERNGDLTPTMPRCQVLDSQVTLL
jgi:hypothetical protein